jgi:serine/threonine protein kinase
VIHGQLKSGEQLGQYRLIQEVGAGSFGVVWEARDQLSRRIALKIPKAPSPALLDQLTEAWHQARLDHENIIRVFGVEEVRDLHLIAMEFADGGSLRQRLATSQIDWRDALRYGQSLCRALAAAHGQGIVHGDLKPENILFTAGGILKVTDFGLSTLIGLPPGQSGGSIPYMAPERFDGTLEPRADLWSLGVILYETVTGQLPFAGETPEATIERIKQRPAAPMRVKETAIPQELALVISRLLAEKPHETFDTATSVLENLSRLEAQTWQGAATSFASADPETAATMPETTIRKILHKRSAWRRIRDHPAAVIGVLLLAGGGITYSMWTRLGASPENATSYFEAGLYHARSSRNGEAITALGKAVTLAPENVRFRRALALLYEETAQPAEAVPEWRIILELDPANAEARDMLARHTP